VERRDVRPPVEVD